MPTPPTVLRITNTNADSDDYPAYEIVDDHSGSWFQAEFLDPFGDNAGFVIPDNLTEAEENDRECVRDGVTWILNEDDQWCKHQGDNSASSFEPWLMSTHEGLDELKDQLKVGMLVHVDTEFFGDGMYINTVFIPYSKHRLATQEG